VALAGETDIGSGQSFGSGTQGCPGKQRTCNDKWDTGTRGESGLLQYKSIDGVGSRSLKPAAWDGRRNCRWSPYVHGGPTGAWIDSVDAWSQLLAARGFAVFMPNIRGSLGVTVTNCIEMKRADWESDFEDVMAGVHDMNRGIADANRLWNCGAGSYGGT